MKPAAFINQLDEARIVAAIAAAERKSSGEIRVYVSHRNIQDALARAKARFVELGMHKTRHRNGVLLYISPRTRQFAIVGDAGVHEKCGDNLWQEIAGGMVPLLRQGQCTEAVEQAIKKTGE